MASGQGGSGGSSAGNVQMHREALQRRTQGDWVNREYAELMTGSIKRIADFLTAFHLSCSSRLSDLNARLTRMERKMEYLEAKVEMRASEDVLTSDHHGLMGPPGTSGGQNPGTTFYLSGMPGVSSSIASRDVIGVDDEADFSYAEDTFAESHT